MTSLLGKEFTLGRTCKTRERKVDSNTSLAKRVLFKLLDFW